MTDVIITVRGEHETRIAPEEGIVQLNVRAEGPERGPVVEQIAARAQPIRDDLAARKDAASIVEWTSQRVSVWSQRPWNSEGKQLSMVHYASVELTATFSDFAAMSWWISEVADRDGVEVGGVQWRLTPETRATTERATASQAVQVAVARAGAYADAIRLRTVTALEIADLGLLSRVESASPVEPRMMRAAMFGAPDAAAAPAMLFQPEDIIVTAAVEARFSAH